MYSLRHCCVKNEWNGFSFLATAMFCFCYVVGRCVSDCLGGLRLNVTMLSFVALDWSDLRSVFMAVRHIIVGTFCGLRIFPLLLLRKGENIFIIILEDQC